MTNYVVTSDLVTLNLDFDDPEQYPDGKTNFVIENVTKKPLASWTAEQNGSKGNKKYFCRGVWI